MANSTIYLDALLTFEEPATVKDVHEKAIEMFGSLVKGDRGSARACLERYIGTGKVIKEGSRYYATIEAADPIMRLTTRIKVLESELEQSRENCRKLEKQLQAART